MWQVSYTLQCSVHAREFAQCSLVYQACEATAKQKADLFKYFTPGAVEEAKLSEWNTKNKLMIITSEKDALDEESVTESLPRLVDLGALKSPMSEDTAFFFGGGNHFNFNDTVSIKTTWFVDNTTVNPSGKEGRLTPTTSTTTDLSSSVSILKSSSLRSVSSEISTNSRIHDLISNMHNINTNLDRIFG